MILLGVFFNFKDNRYSFYLFLYGIICSLLSIASFLITGTKLPPLISSFYISIVAFQHKFPKISILRRSSLFCWFCSVQLLPYNSFSPASVKIDYRFFCCQMVRAVHLWTTVLYQQEFVSCCNHCDFICCSSAAQGINSRNSGCVIPLTFVSLEAPHAIISTMPKHFVSPVPMNIDEIIIHHQLLSPKESTSIFNVFDSILFRCLL